ncbi:MAG: WxcM-like domain-containing protein, partial [Methylobacteriaceae bacterium]|nr:WxcM-like domain-containing protein [Methylobacteriaceae bacterium]
MSIIQGTALIEQRVHADDRGELVVFQQLDNLPFSPKRIFCMKVND